MVEVQDVGELERVGCGELGRQYCHYENGQQIAKSTSVGTFKNLVLIEMYN